MANDILARLSVLFEAQTQQFGTALNNLSGQLNKFGGAVKAQEGAITRFEKTISGVQKSLGSLGLAFGAFQIANVFTDAIGRISDFEKQMDTLAAITGATGKEFEALRNDALRLGAATQFTSKEVGELQTELGRLGFTTDEILNATEAIVKLSIATGEDLAKSADVAGSTIRAFQLDASETQRVVDVMAESFNKSALGLENFSEAMKYVAPIAASANISVEETTALLGTLADAGIRGSSAGTALRKIITDLAKDGRPLAERLKELAKNGIDFAKANDEVGRTAYASLLVLANQTEKTDKLTESLLKSAGAAQKTADIMQDNLAGDVTKLSSAYDGLILSLSEGTGILRSFVQGLTDLLNIATAINNSDIGKFLFDLVTAGPRAVAGIVDNVAALAGLNNELEEASEKTKEFFRDLVVLKSVAEFEGRADDVIKYGEAIDELKRRYKGLGETITGEVGPAIASSTDIFITTANQIFGSVGEQKGIVAQLEERLKSLGQSIKDATSVEAIRAFQRELEATKAKLDAILNPSVAPTPITIPVVFGEINTQELEESIKRINEQAKITIEPVDIEIGSEDTSFGDALAEKLKTGIDRVREFTAEFNELLNNSIQGTIVAFAEDIGRAIAGVGNFGDGILNAFAGFAKQFGALLISAGLAKIAFEKLAISGIGAVAAGIALVAAASAVSGHLSKAGSVGRGSAGGGSVGVAASGGTRNNLQSASQSIHVEFGKVTWNGRELEAALKYQNQVNNTIGG